MNPPSQVLRHVVMFRFRDGVTPDQIRSLQNGFCSLPSKVEEIHDLEWGTDASVEGLSQGYTHCFVVTFLSEGSRAAYLAHPAHEEFKNSLKPHLEKLLVLDYWTRP